MQKNAKLIVIKDAAQLLRVVASMLEEATPTLSDAQLILPLLLASGRRTSALLNGRSTFLPLPEAHYCLFGGQLKKKGAAVAYRIPLLVPYELFDRGLRALRAKQGEAQVSNAEASRKYQGNLGRAGLPCRRLTFPKRNH